MRLNIARSSAIAAALAALIGLGLQTAEACNYGCISVSCFYTKASKCASWKGPQAGTGYTNTGNVYPTNYLFTLTSHNYYRFNSYCSPACTSLPTIAASCNTPTTGYTQANLAICTSPGNPGY